MSKKDLPVTMVSDDIVIFNESWEDHLSSVNSVLQALEDYGMECNPKKCKFSAESSKFVGRIVSADGIRPCGDKVTAIKEMDVFNNKTLRSFIGLASYYRKLLHLSWLV